MRVRLCLGGKRCARMRGERVSSTRGSGAVEALPVGADITLVTKKQGKKRTTSKPLERIDG